MVDDAPDRCTYCPDSIDLSIIIGISLTLVRDAAPSSITFRLDNSSGVPPYLQIVHQVEHALRLGYLRRGDQLPRVKDVVASLAINPNTVLKAYRQLEQKGLIGGRPGQGTFVESDGPVAVLGDLSALEKRLVTGWFPDAEAAGLDEEGMRALFMSAMRSFHARRERAAHSRRTRAPVKRGIAG